MIFFCFMLCFASATSNVILSNYSRMLFTRLLAADDLGATQAVSMYSKDGEEVRFKSPIAIGDRGVKEWLKSLENEMRRTLALLLGEAVGSTGELALTNREDAQVSHVPVFDRASWEEGVSSREVQHAPSAPNGRGRLPRKAGDVGFDV